MGNESDNALGNEGKNALGNRNENALGKEGVNDLGNKGDNALGNEGNNYNIHVDATPSHHKMIGPTRLKFKGVNIDNIEIKTNLFK